MGLAERLANTEIPVMPGGYNIPRIINNPALNVWYNLCENNHSDNVDLPPGVDVKPPTTTREGT